MDPQIVAIFWWALLALSLLLTFIAVPLRSWPLALLATVCSLVFAIAALASIGIYILIVTLLQAVITFLLYRRQPQGAA